MFLLTLFYNAFSLFYSYFKFLDSEHVRIGSRAFARIVANICVHGRHQEQLFTATKLKK